MVMRESKLFLLPAIILGVLLAACGGGSDGVKKSDTARVYQFPVAPSPMDTPEMVEPLPADTSLQRMPVRSLPDTGAMPVKKPDEGVLPK